MYETFIDQIDGEEWDNLCSLFPGMSLYQTGLYGELHSNGVLRSCSRIAISKNTKIIAAAQLRIKKIPFFAAGVAEVDWGPLWMPVNGSIDRFALKELLDGIREEYCNKRGLQVRIRPRSTMSQEIDSALNDLFIQRGYLKNNDARPYQTVAIDLFNSLDTIRAGFHQKWRNQLNVAERAGLEHVSGNSIEYFDRFYAIYKAMWNLKKFPTGVRLPVIRGVTDSSATTREIFSNNCS
jgi:hypothetical protein